jgi:hypothetical protein
MNDMLSTIVPKSDQLNADDLLSGQTIAIKITKVSIHSGEQPVAISFENDNGKPWKPCKSMCRVLVNVWGKDANQYIGRSLMLYCDPSVKFGGLAVGGIRISHMSHIAEPVTMALTATKGNKKPFTVKPLAGVAEPKADVAPVEDFISDIDTALTLEAMELKYKAAYKVYHKNPEALAQIIKAKDKRKAELTVNPEEQPPLGADTGAP